MEAKLRRQLWGKLHFHYPIQWEFKQYEGHPQILCFPSSLPPLSPLSVLSFSCSWLYFMRQDWNCENDNGDLLAVPGSLFASFLCTSFKANEKMQKCSSPRKESYSLKISQIIRINYSKLTKEVDHIKEEVISSHA